MIHIHRAYHSCKVDIVAMVHLLLIRLGVVGLVVLWPLHVKVRRQPFNEHYLDPAGHGMRQGRSVEEIDDDDGDGDGDANHGHGEEEIYTDERDRACGRRDHLGDQEQEHDEGEEDRDAERYLVMRKKMKQDETIINQIDLHSFKRGVILLTWDLGL